MPSDLNSDEISKINAKGFKLSCTYEAIERSLKLRHQQHVTDLKEMRRKGFKCPVVKGGLCPFD